MPRCWRQAGGQSRQRRWQKSSVHRGERIISRKAIAQGMSDVLRFTCMLMRALSVHTAHEIAGAARIRHSLRPLIFLGGASHTRISSGRVRAAGPRRRVWCLKFESGIGIVNVRRANGVLPPPLRGRAGERGFHRVPMTCLTNSPDDTTPLPNPPPQGGRERRERVSPQVHNSKSSRCGISGISAGGIG